MHADCIETERSKSLQSIKERLSLRSKLKLRERERDDNWLVLIHAEIDMDNVKELEKLQWQKSFETRAHA
jgi:hypothetical protein